MLAKIKDLVYYKMCSFAVGSYLFLLRAPDSPTNGSQATNETPPSPGCHGNHLNGGKRDDCNDRIVPQLKIGEDGNIIVDEQR